MITLTDAALMAGCSRKSLERRVERGSLAVVPDDLTDELLDALPFNEMIFKWGLHVGYTLMQYTKYQANKTHETVFTAFTDS